MNGIIFDNACNYVSELISLFPEALERGIGPESQANLLTMSHDALRSLQAESIILDFDGEPFSVLTDRVDDPEFKLPDELAIESVRRMRRMCALTAEDHESRKKEGTLEEVERILSYMVGNGLKELSSRLMLADRLLQLYDDWCNVDMGNFGEMLVTPLMVGSSAVESVLGSLDDDEECDEPLTEEEVPVVHHAYELLKDYYGRINDFLKRYPDLTGNFCSEECDECIFNGLHGEEEL